MPYNDEFSAGLPTSGREWTLDQTRYMTPEVELVEVRESRRKLVERVQEALVMLGDGTSHDELRRLLVNAIIEAGEKP